MDLEFRLKPHAVATAAGGQWESTTVLEARIVGNRSSAAYLYVYLTAYQDTGKLNVFCVLGIQVALIINIYLNNVLEF